MCGRHGRKAPAGRRRKDIAGRAAATASRRGGNRVHSREARRSVDVLGSVWVVDERSETERAVAIERVYNAFAEVIVIDAGAGTDRHLSGSAAKFPQPTALRRRTPGDSESRREILIVPGPIWRLAVRLA